MRYDVSMRNTVTTRISRGGQVTVPAPVRHRWQTTRIAVEDHGDHLVLRPLADPIDNFVGFASGRRAPASEAMRARSRAEEAAAETRRT